MTHNLYLLLQEGFTRSGRIFDTIVKMTNADHDGKYRVGTIQVLKNGDLKPLSCETFEDKKQAVSKWRETYDEYADLMI